MMIGSTTRDGQEKQKSPAAIRGALQRYIDQHNMTKAAMIRALGVNSNTFGKFMNPKTYKNMWSATDNGTYWAGAKFLALKQWENAQAKKNHKKRKATADINSSNNNNAENVPNKKKTKADALALMENISNAMVETNENDPQVLATVYDSCPELVKKIKTFLQESGATKAAFLQIALGGVNSNSLQRFLLGKKQDQCGNICYQRAYAFLEQQRLLDGTPKTAQRRRHEAEHPNGFCLERTSGWIIAADEVVM